MGEGRTMNTLEDRELAIRHPPATGPENAMSGRGPEFPIEGPAGSAAELRTGGYRGQTVALLTQHGKERVISPVLELELGCRVQLVTGYDTDQLGTFTLDVPRAGAQVEAARRKARIGIELSGLPLGLASEGAFRPDPMVGMFPWNVELLLFIDDDQGLEIVGVAQGRASHAHRVAADWAQAEAFARESGFPEHHLVVRAGGEKDPRLRKGIASWEDLDAAFAWAQSQSASGQVFLETDLRAHANPTRMQMIRLAALDLAARLKSLCPSCAAPGFWLVEKIPGLPCSGCGAPTHETRAEVLSCVKCTHAVTRVRTDQTCADPGRCNYCNP